MTSSFPYGPIPPREVTDEAEAWRIHRAEPDQWSRPQAIANGRWLLYSRDPRARLVNEDLAREAWGMRKSPPAPPPSPGPSSGRSELTDADRKRISEQVKQRDRAPDPQYQQPTLL